MNNKPVRNKGKSLLYFPKSYVVIDIETTGTVCDYEHITEIGAYKIKSGVVESFDQLVDPGVMLNDFIINLTGITNEMLDGKPHIREVISAFYDFVENLPIIGHNVNFDINLLYDAVKYEMGEDLNNDFVDTLRLSKKLHPEFAHHKLMNLAQYYGVDYTGAHRAINDCIITANVLECMRGEVVWKYGSVENFYIEIGAVKKTKRR